MASLFGSAPFNCSYTVCLLTRSFCALVTLSFSWLSRDMTMFCRSSSDPALLVSRYCVSASSLWCSCSSYRFSSSPSQVSVLSVLARRRSMFCCVYSSAMVLAASAANCGLLWL